MAYQFMPISPGKADLHVGKMLKLVPVMMVSFQNKKKETVALTQLFTTHRLTFIRPLLVLVRQCLYIMFRTPLSNINS